MRSCSQNRIGLDLKAENMQKIMGSTRERLLTSLIFVTIKRGRFGFRIPYEFEIGHGMDHGFGEALFSELRGWIERSVAFLNKIEGVAERK